MPMRTLPALLICSQVDEPDCAALARFGAATNAGIAAAAASVAASVLRRATSCGRSELSELSLAILPLPRFVTCVRCGGTAGVEAFNIQARDRVRDAGHRCLRARHPRQIAVGPAKLSQPQ